MAEIEKATQAAAEEQQVEKAKRVREATFLTVESCLMADFQLLENAQPQQKDQAVETAKDLKYVRERQMNMGRYSS